MTHAQELQMRLDDLRLKLEQEQKEIIPSELYIADLLVTIGWIERQLSFIIKTEHKEKQNATQAKRI